MLRWLGTGVIALLFFLNAALPSTTMGRRGHDGTVKSDVAGAAGAIGAHLPGLSLTDLDGTPVRLADLRGQAVLLTFERSVDW